MNKRIFKDETSTIGEIPFYKIGTFGGKADAFITREKYEEYKRKYPYPQKGNLLISASGSIGRIIEYNGEEAYYQDSNIVWLDHDNTILDIFLKPTYEIIKWDGIEGTTIKRLYNKNILNTVIYKPTIDEQSKIGKLFIILNNTIQLHERKCEELTLIKQALLQKLFPKKDEFKPEVRYKNFSDAWEQRKLGEVTEYIKGFAFKSKDYKKSGHRIIRVSDLGKDSIINNNDSIFVTDEISKQQNKYKINKNEIIITTVGSKAELKESAVGRPIIVRNSLGYLLNQNLVKIHGKNNKDSRFIYYQLLQPRYSQYIATIQRGNANQANIAISDLWNYRIFITKHNEQQKIGNFFQQLDSLITLHQRKLEKLKQLKKFLLQNMFI